MENRCGEKIKERLHALDMTQADLCRKTGISRATMSQYANGKYFPTQDRLELISTALQTTPAYLMGWSEETQGYDPLKDADWRKFEYLYHLPEGSVELIRLYNSMDSASKKQLVFYAKFLLSQKE